MNLPIIGLTGLTGSGKTTVSDLLAGYGGFCVNADRLAHEVIKKGEPAYYAVLDAFIPASENIFQKSFDVFARRATDSCAKSEFLFAPWNNIKGQDGEIDRRKLGEAVFADKEKMKLLESIIHPPVMEAAWAAIRQAAAEGKYHFAVIDAPLLIEAGMHRQCDSVWLVTASEEVRKSRVMQRDDLPEAETRKRLASRNSEESLLPHVQVIIRNDGDLTGLVCVVREELGRLGYYA